MRMNVDTRDEQMNQRSSSRLSNLRELVAGEQTQFVVLVVLSLSILLFTVILYLSGTPRFESFFGRINPLVIISLTILIGFGLTTYLLSRGWLDIYKRENLKGFLLISLLTIPFALGAILVDLAFPYPEDANVLLPKSLEERTGLSQTRMRTTSASPDV